MKATRQAKGTSMAGSVLRARHWLRSSSGAVWGAAGALALGLAAQSLLDAKAALEVAGLGYGAAALLFAASQPQAPRQADAASDAPREAEMPHLGRYLVAAAGLAAAAFPLFSGNRFSPAGTGLWFASIAVLVCGSLPERVRGWLAGRSGVQVLGNGREGWRPSRAWIGLATALAIGAFLRLYRLAEIPREMGADVPHVYTNIRAILDGDYLIFFPSHPGREGLFFYLAAAIARLFGLSHTTIKLSSALVGLSCIPIIYLLGRELFGRRAGVAAAFLLSVSHWHIICSRSGLRAGSELPLMMLAWLWLARGLRRRRRWEFLLSGLALGLGMHTYNAFAAVPLAIGALLLGEAFLGRGARLRANRRNLVVMALAALVAFTPLARYAWEEPRMYAYRAATRLTGLERDLPGDLLAVALGNVWRSLLMFQYQGDSVYATNVPFLRQLGYLTAVLFALGGALVAGRWRSGYNLAVLSALGITLLPTALSLAFPQEVPNAYRAIGALPPAMLLAGAGLAEVWGRASEGLRLSERELAPGTAVTCVCGAVLGIGLLGGLAWEAREAGRTYFEDYRLSQPRHNYSISLEMARVMDESAVGETYAVAWPHWYDGNAVRVQLRRRDPASWHDVSVLLPGEPPLTSSAGDTLVIVHPDDQATQDLLREAFPRGIFVTHRDYEGYVAFLAFYSEK